MGAATLVLWSRWRRRPGDQVALAIVVALAGAVVLATLAGARRTETAYARFDRSVGSPDVIVDTLGGAGVVFTPEQIAAVESLPQVRGAGVLRGLAMQPAIARLYQPIAAPVDGAVGTSVWRHFFVEGRAPRTADEMTMTEGRARLLGLRLGDHLIMASFTPKQLQQLRSGDGSAFDQPDGPTIDLTLVGIERTLQSISTDRDLASITMLDPSFIQRYGDRVGAWSDLLAVDLIGESRAVDEFTAAVHAIAGLEDLQFEPSTAANLPVVSTLDFVATALRIFAAIAAIAGTVAVALVLVRAMSVERSEGPVLAALGWSPRRRRMLLVMGILPGVTAGLGGAIVGAVLASPLFPFGLGARAEPHPGVDVNVAVMVLGGLGIAVGIVLLTTMASRWSTRAAPNAGRAQPSRVIARLGAMNLPVPAVTGVRFVVERGRRGDTVAVRSAISGVALGVAGLLGVITYTSSRAWLDDTPTAWGRTWDVTAEPQLVDQLIAPDTITARSRVRITTVEIAGHPIEARGFDALVGPSMIPIATGRRPGPGEVALGTGTMEELGLSVGDTVQVKGTSGDATMEVAGVAMFTGISDVPVLNSGVAMEMSTLERVSDPSSDDHFDVDALRLAPGTLDRPLRLALAVPDGTPAADVERLLEGDRPDELSRLDEVRSLPWLLALFLGWLAATATAALLIGAVRRRRHDLAVLRAVGLDSRAVRRVVLVQSFTVSALGLAIGIPLGLVVGRLAWTSVAGDLGTVVRVNTPLSAVVATAFTVILLNAAVSLIPAVRAGRTSAAVALRVE